MAYDDPDKRIEEFLKEWGRVVWGWLKFGVRFAIEVFKEGRWVFDEAIPRRRRRGY